MQLRGVDERYAKGIFNEQMARYLVLQPIDGPVRSYKNSPGRIAYGRTSHDDLYQDFKTYVRANVRSGELELDVPELYVEEVDVRVLCLYIMSVALNTEQFM